MSWSLEQQISHQNKLGDPSNNLPSTSTRSRGCWERAAGTKKRHTLCSMRKGYSLLYLYMVIQYVLPVALLPFVLKQPGSCPLPLARVNSFFFRAFESWHYGCARDQSIGPRLWRGRGVWKRGRWLKFGQARCSAFGVLAAGCVCARCAACRRTTFLPSSLAALLRVWVRYFFSDYPCNHSSLQS